MKKLCLCLDGDLPSKKYVIDWALYIFIFLYIYMSYFFQLRPLEKAWDHKWVQRLDRTQMAEDHNKETEPETDFNIFFWIFTQWAWNLKNSAR